MMNQYNKNYCWSTLSWSVSSMSIDDSLVVAMPTRGLVLWKLSVPLPWRCLYVEGHMLQSGLVRSVLFTRYKVILSYPCTVISVGTWANLEVSVVSGALKCLSSISEALHWCCTWMMSKELWLTYTCPGRPCPAAGLHLVECLIIIGEWRRAVYLRVGARAIR